MTLRTIIIISDFMKINGGQSKVAIDSAVLLANSGLDVVFVGGQGPTDVSLFHPRIRIVDLNQHDILTDPRRMRAIYNGIWNHNIVRQLRSLIAQFDPASTVLHAHGYAKVMSPSIGPILTDGPLAAVYTMHEYFLACPNGGFYDFQRQEICTRRALSASCLACNCDMRHPAHKAWRVARQVATLGPGRMPRRLRDVIYISETQRRVMAPYLAPQTRLHHVPNPVALPDLPQIDAAKNEIFLFIGRYSPEKGALMFARAARSAGVKAVFVGDGDEAGAIRAANPDAVITGWQTPAQVQDWIGRARALVFPSLWYETFGLVAYEALARGVPVIAGAWSAAAANIIDGQNGWIYARPDENLLADTLRRAQSGAIGASMPPFTEFSPQDHLDRLLCVYEDLPRKGWS